MTKCDKRKVGVNFMPKPLDVSYGRPIWSGINRQEKEDDFEESETRKPPLHPLSGGTSDLDRKRKLRLRA